MHQLKLSSLNRQMFRLLRIDTWVFVALAAALLTFTGCGDSRAAGGPRVIVLGFDGMDYGLAQKYLAAGKMPNFSRLIDQGGQFGPLETSVPPLSPVAWSNFITGMDGGGHGIFDFIHRDPATMIPYLSTSKTLDSEMLEIGKYQFPLSGGGWELLRRGQAFWEALENKGVETTIVRMPANFPPSETAPRELSGMGTPDILGGYGTFSFYTSVLFAFSGEEIGGGNVYEVWEEDGVVEGKLYGPDNPFLKEREKVSIDFKVYVDPVDPYAKLVVGDEEHLLEPGRWSDWVPVEFDLIPTQSLPGMARFYLRSVRPEFEMYVSPINFDPMDAAVPVSYPPEYAEALAEATGRFYTQGMPEEVNALREEVISRDEFLSQSEIAGREIREQWPYVLEQFEAGPETGLLFYYFGNLDQVSHMMLGSLDPERPGYDPEVDPKYAAVIEQLYREADDVVGETLEKIDEDTLLVIMSDHGFASLRRRMSLNTWLKENGYLTLKDPNIAKDPGLFLNVDWSKTRAYAAGLNGLYINVRGREKNGIVDPADRLPLLREISDKLLATLDPATGEQAVTRTYISEEYFQDRGALDIGPDMVIGYARGTGGNDDSALGEIPKELFTDNLDEWSGDHGMDHTTVPGVLLTSRPLTKPATSLKNLAASILAEFGVENFPAASS